jgi:hypothetical protein|tara:strand:+ start:6909 stop:7256 length:348 start_codon:yes stop_codon:yes gene_type:complete
VFYDEAVPGGAVVLSPEMVRRGIKIANYPAIQNLLQLNPKSWQAWRREANALLTKGAELAKEVELLEGCIAQQEMSLRKQKEQNATLQARLDNQQKHFDNMTLWQHLRAWWRSTR